MKRLNDEEKRQLGLLIFYYRSSYFRSARNDNENFKQVNFCRGICSQAQLSRLENGEPLKDHEIYWLLLDKLNLKYERISSKEVLTFESYYEYIYEYQNNDQLAINYNEYILMINHFQNVFRNNVIYTHYNYALEFIVNILNEDLEEAYILLELVEKTLDILPPQLLILTLHYIGKYYYLINEYHVANKYYLLSLEHMHKNNLSNNVIYFDIAINEIKRKSYIQATYYLNRALGFYLNTNNQLTLGKIYFYFGLLYTLNKEYDISYRMLNKALEIAHTIHKRELLVNIYNLYVVNLYLTENLQKALIYLNEALLVESNKISRLLEVLIKHKLKQNPDDNLLGDNYFEIYQFVKLEDKEKYFEEVIELKLNKYDILIQHVVLNELYVEYKTKKKYKKALELLEKYKI